MRRRRAPSASRSRCSASANLRASVAWAEAGEENAVAQRIAAKMLAIKRAKGKDRARAAPAAPAALPDPFPESEGWL